MRTGVSLQNQADSFAAGAAAAREALASGGLERCDLILVLSTAAHDSQALRDGIRSVTGPQPRLVGGWSVGALTNDRLGYGGYEVGLAAFQLDGVQCEVLDQASLAENGEEAVGAALGARLAALDPDAVLLLYDSVARIDGRMRLNMATPLLAGIEQAAGRFPPLVGAGLCGDMTGTATYQLVDDRIAQQTAIALAFKGLRMDSVIMHGCQPATDYWTVTRADGPTLLELDGRPAVEVVSELLGSGMPVEEYGFFVTLGINKGDKWGEFDETRYVNRLCLKVDKKRQGLVMFEPDITEGTQVQLMHRSLDMNYIAPRVESCFERLQGRRPVFALYIDCAGRAASYAGMDAEDAAMVQQAVAGRVPLLGFYSGVEIGMVEGRPQPLDWTGVFCLFSLPDETA